MKEKFEPFKELLKALREIKYAIGGKNSGTGNGNDIVLPKYALCNYFDKSDTNVSKVLEIDYDGKVINLDYISEEELHSLSEEEITTLMQFAQNYTTNPVTSDFTKGSIRLVAYCYTKEQIDIINKNSIIQLFNGTITKFDNNVVLDILDSLDIYTGLPTEISNIQRGQYYYIVLKAVYDQVNTPQTPIEPPIVDPGTIH